MILSFKTLIALVFLFSIISGLSLSDKNKNNQDINPQPLKATVSNKPTIFKAKDGDCYAPRQVNGHGVCACLDRKNYVPQRNQCVCPKYAPFWNGQYCSGCPPGMDFNLDLGICYVCPEGFTRGYKIMTCIPGLLGTPRISQVSTNNPVQAQKTDKKL